MISCIIPTYKEPEYLDLCLQTAILNRKREDTEIIVVVDGFYELNKSVLDKWKSDFVHVISFKENHGIQMATNYGVWAANNPWIFLVNDDNVFPKDWDERMLEIIDEERIRNSLYHISFNQIEPGIRCPVGFGFTKKDFGGTRQDFNLEGFLSFESPTEGQNNKYPDYTRGNTLPILLPKKSFMTVGGWDTLYDSPHVCDCDFFLKLELMGSKFVTDRRLSFYHFSGKATKFSDSSDSHRQYQEYSRRETAAWQTFMIKWGFVPGNSTSNSKFPSLQEEIKKTFKGISYIK